MIEDLGWLGHNVGVFRFGGQISDNDYRNWLGKIESLVKHQGKIRLLIYLDGIEFDFERFWRQEGSDRITPYLERLAVVSPKVWHGIDKRLERHMLRGQIKHFLPVEEQKAKRWITSDNPRNQPSLSDLILSISSAREALKSLGIFVFGVVFVWYGLWEMIPLYLFPHDREERAWSALVIGLTVLATTRTLHKKL